MARPCPQCQRSISSDVPTCPHCGVTLVAYGHPGLVIQRSRDGTPLCDTCVYHRDDSCTFPHRPTAQDCTLYRDVSSPEPDLPPRSRRVHLSTGQRLSRWAQNHRGAVILVALVLGALLLQLLG
ncbi:hypothetical protein [Prochlorothrix hollandica]|uniref:DZANK-type domain-containing protein n=1 Tax=Prochlorothrix hollandica PCC 9006 = CALU 1027 TaxID=317619 RepID=A0A0M2Q110_PROHO|nr:hypothetical protein [Prochlorothrix hollandica]KKJ00649.1 hypothetical protein PROH_04935 [Prochlorothrix hollandica PCC 9006 = CALU 1027]